MPSSSKPWVAGRFLDVLELLASRIKNVIAYAISVKACDVGRLLEVLELLAAATAWCRRLRISLELYKIWRLHQTVITFAISVSFKFVVTYAISLTKLCDHLCHLPQSHVLPVDSWKFSSCWPAASKT